MQVVDCDAVSERCDVVIILVRAGVDWLAINEFIVMPVSPRQICPDTDARVQTRAIADPQVRECRFSMLSKASGAAAVQKCKRSAESVVARFFSLATYLRIRCFRLARSLHERVELDEAHPMNVS